MTNDVANKTLLKEKEGLIKELPLEWARWQYIKDHGCRDPFWPDGTNMNLVRNHIIYDKQRLLELCEQLNESLPEEYYIQTPPEVDDNYMCKVGKYFKKRKQHIEAYGMTVVTKPPKVKNTGQTELF